MKKKQSYLQEHVKKVFFFIEYCHKKKSLGSGSLPCHHSAPFESGEVKEANGKFPSMQAVTSLKSEVIQNECISSSMNST
jgi:hypothetical protein